jgi:hypothetical protein
MDFIELDRCFVPLAKDQEPSLELGRIWGRKLDGWLDWRDLHQRRRVVLLAEASSGKTEEFRNQAEQMKHGGRSAFYLRIEELADQGFGAALDKGAANDFDQWCKGAQEGWFFLDSIDEARLNRKSFETALRRFASELDVVLERTHVYISCRVSDWKGPDDRSAIARWLPAWDPAKPAPTDIGNSSALLDVIFSEKNEQHAVGRSIDEKPHELLVVQLAPLHSDQYRKLAQSAGVTDIDAFVQSIAKKGLEAFTERPGDVLELADYWANRGGFGSFADMVEHGVTRKLRERDPHRADNQLLSIERARVGAERLAAALTLGKSFTLKAAGADPDPSLASGALDPSTILQDWNDAERITLLRRGIFAPATYGRVRFHHRATQEYLTARWFHRLLLGHSARPSVWSLIFTDHYGVETVVPSLRSAVAWLCLWHPDLRDETLRREPLILLRNGDPGSLPLDVRRRLLAEYAKKQAAGEISDGYLDHRSLWMFAHQSLAGAITRAWQSNTRNDFRLDLLRLIREGGVRGCLDIVRNVFRDRKADDSHRIVALQAMAECADTSGLEAAAKALTEGAEEASSQPAPVLARLLYPKYLSTNALLDIIACSIPPRQKGFFWHLEELHTIAPNNLARDQLIGGIADLCLTKPFVADYQKVSKRYFVLTDRLHAIAAREVKLLGTRAPTTALVRFLMVVERSSRNASRHDGDEDLHALVRANPVLNRALFWADVKDQRFNSRDPVARPIRHWQVLAPGTLWGFSDIDLPWLYRDLAQGALEDDRRLALSAIVTVLERIKQLATGIANLKKRIGRSPILGADLVSYLTLPKEDPTLRTLRLNHEKWQARHNQQRKADKASWVKFSKALRQNPGQLSNPKNLVSWRAGIFRLKHLTYWLQQRAKASDERAPCEWRLLTEGFGRDVAEAYRDGMKVVWRNIKPERPVGKPGGGVTVKWTTVLAFGGLALEAAEDADAMAKLSEVDARTAARHACFSDQGYPEWIEALVVSHPHATLSVLKTQLAREWNSPADTYTTFLHRYASVSSPLQQPVQAILLDLYLGNEASTVRVLDLHWRIVRNLQLDATQREDVSRITKLRLKNATNDAREDFVLQYLGCLLVLEPDETIDTLEAWLTECAPSTQRSRAEAALSTFFGRNNPIALDALAKATVPTLERLLTIAYSFVRPEKDAVHEGPYAPTARDYAENARSAILSALLDRRGGDAFRAILRVSKKPAFIISELRFRELARGKAERDAEFPAWTANEVLTFERDHVAPVKTGADLLLLTLGILNDIALKLTDGDVSSRPLLERAKDENEVQHWLVEQLIFRAKGRFNAYREVQVAGGNKPDIIISSSAAPCEVAIEVKHGGKGWTVRQLEAAVRSQLAEEYLKPESRRHGVLVVTHHKNRRWFSPTNNRPLSFDDVIKWLSKVAKATVENKSAPVEVHCVGISAFLNPAQARKPRLASQMKSGPGTGHLPRSNRRKAAG